MREATSPKERKREQEVEIGKKEKVEEGEVN